MKKQFITATLAAVLSLSVAPLAFAQAGPQHEIKPVPDYNPNWGARGRSWEEVGRQNKDYLDVKTQNAENSAKNYADAKIGNQTGGRWVKPGAFKTDDKGFVLDKEGKRAWIPTNISGSQGGYLKADADKTGFVSHGGVPTLYTETGEESEMQWPSEPMGVVPGSPVARHYAEGIISIIAKTAATEPSKGEYSAAERIDANSGIIDRNGNELVDVDTRLQRLQGEWGGRGGQFGRDNNGDPMSATGAIISNTDGVDLLKKRLDGNIWPQGVFGKSADGKNYDLEQGFVHIRGQVDVGKNADGSDKTVKAYVDEGNAEMNRHVQANESAIGDLQKRADIGENGAIAQNSKRLDAHDSQIADNTKAIEQNKSDIKDLADNTGIRFDQNEQKIADNAVKIAENRSQLDKNTSDIDKLNQRADIGENGAIAQNTKKIAENKDRLDGKGGAFGKWEGGSDKTIEEGFADHNKRLNAQDVEIDTNSRAIEGLGQQGAEQNKRLDAHDAAIEQNKNGIEHVNGRIGDLGTADQMAVIDEKTGGFKRDKNGNIARKGQETKADASVMTATDKKENTVADWVAQGKAAYQDLNERFDTMQGEGKAYIDQTAQQTLKSANDYTDSRYNQLNGKVKKLRARADSGIAGATAIGSLAFDTLKANSIAGGLGIAKNKVAGAVGYQRNFNENWRARGTVSVSDNYVQGGASVGYSW